MSRVRTVFSYGSWPDQEILEERLLSLSCDEDTWLYKMEGASHNEQPFDHRISLMKKYFSTATGVGVDSRTFTRRKHGSQRSSLDSNRSSLGLLSSSKLSDDLLTEKDILKAGNREKTSSSFTASETFPKQFKLDTPFANHSPLERNRQLTTKHFVYDRLRFDSESSESSIIPSLENYSPFEKNDNLTDSLVVFLEKEVPCRPPTQFQDDGCMSDSLISLSADQDPRSSLFISNKNEAMTDSLVNFLDPVNCKPPSGFEDGDMSNSTMKIKESDVLPSCDLTSSVLDYLENVRPSSCLVESTTSSETENIPPNICDSNENLTSTCVKPPSVRTVPTNKLNSTYALEDGEDVSLSEINECNNTVNITITKGGKSNYDLKDNNDMSHIVFTNTVNISRKSKVNRETFQDVKSTKPVSFKSENTSMHNNNGRSLRTDASMRESSIIQGHKNESNKYKSYELLSDEQSYRKNDVQTNGSLSKSGMHDTSNLSRQIPQRNSTFNTTFTKLMPPSKNSTFVKSTEGLNGGLEDDQISSASDSSLSSGSTKPRSYDELQNIALQQERSLVYQSTPTDTDMGKLDIELSPIRGLSCGRGRSRESRSANSSPVRSSTQRPLHPHPVSRLQQPLLGAMQHRHTSSMLNIARPQVSRMRMPQTMSRMTVTQGTETRPITAPAPAARMRMPQTMSRMSVAEETESRPRPITAPAPAATGIPRPQASRLPMPRFRGSGIPGPRKRGAFH